MNVQNKPVEFISKKQKLKFLKQLRDNKYISDDYYKNTKRAIKDGDSLLIRRPSGGGYYI